MSSEESREGRLEDLLAPSTLHDRGSETDDRGLLTPVELASELGIDPKRLRAWLRRHAPRPERDKGSRWSLTPTQVAAARAAFVTAHRDDSGTPPGAARPTLEDASPESVSDSTFVPLGGVPPLGRDPAWRRLVGRGRSWWRSIGPDPSKAYFRTRDTKENLEYQIPSHERVQLHCLWLTEFYTPSEADQMIRRMQSMRQSMKVGGDHDFATWAKEIRGQPNSGGSHTLGYLIPRGSRRHFIGPDILETNLPQGVTHAPASVISLTPSLTALVIQFNFDDSVTKEWVAPLGQVHATRRRRSLGMIRYLGPGHQKAKAAADARRAVRARCGRWIKQTVPGYFSALPGDDNHPAIEFVTLSSAKPLDAWGRLDDYMYALDLYESVDTWTIDGSVRFRRGGLIEKSPRVGVLAGREDEVHAWNLWDHTGHGWNTEGVLIGLQHLDQFVATVAVDSLIRSYETSLAATRDRLSDDKHGGTDAVLGTLQRQLAGLSRGVQSIGPELAEMAGRPWFVRDLGGLEWHHEIYAGKPKPAEILAKSYKDRALGLAANEQVVRELLVASAQVAAAHEGLRLQRTARLIAFIGVGIALVSVGVSVLSFVILNR